MSADRSRARHRSARRPSTPLTTFAAAAAGGLSAAGRRSVAVAASSGLLVTFSAVSAQAADRPGVMPVDVTTLTASARAALATSPTVSVPADAGWTFAAPSFTVEKPAPEPTRTSAPSRSQARAALAGDATATGRTATASADSAPATAGAAVPQAVSGNAVLEIAARYIGVRYLSGGNTPAGFDCSGFTSYVYAQLGISLPVSSSAQRYVGTVVSREDARPGDLVWSPGHVGLYAGGNQMIDAPRPGKTIQFRAMWQSNPVFIRVTA